MNHAPAARPKPIHEIRFGAIRAAIWENRTGDVVRYNVTFSRSYRDGEQWKNTDNFGRDDLLTVAKAADHAHTWICGQRPAPPPA